MVPGKFLEQSNLSGMCEIDQNVIAVWYPWKSLTDSLSRGLSYILRLQVIWMRGTCTYDELEVADSYTPYGRCLTELGEGTG